MEHETKPHMDPGEFLKQEYIALREETVETKERIFKTLGFGLVVVPAFEFLAKTYDQAAPEIVLFVPLLVIVVALVYLSENNSLMRSGQYIKERIETTVVGVKGWEHWLEESSNEYARGVDKYLSYAFYMLFFVYYAASVALAGSLIMNYGEVTAGILFGAYTAIGLWFVFYLYGSIRLSTRERKSR